MRIKSVEGICPRYLPRSPLQTAGIRPAGRPGFAGAVGLRPPKPSCGRFALRAAYTPKKSRTPTPTPTFDPKEKTP